MPPDTGREPRRQVADLLARLAGLAGAGDQPTASERARLLAGLTTTVAASLRTAGAAALVGGRWLADTLLDVAPRIPVRDAATLSAHHGGRTGEPLADSLVAAASRASAAVGAGGGALAAVQWAAPPTLLAAPAQIAAETLAVAAIEVKLIAELHEVYGVPVRGSGTQRAAAYVSAWAARRGVDPTRPSGMTAVMGAAAKHRLRRRLAGRLGRNLSTMGPLLTGAVAGGWVNGSETRKLADAVRHDLRALASGRPAGQTTTSSMPGGSLPVERRQ